MKKLVFFIFHLVVCLTNAGVDNSRLVGPVKEADSVKEHYYLIIQGAGGKRACVASIELDENGLSIYNVYGSVVLPEFRSLSLLKLNESKTFQSGIVTFNDKEGNLMTDKALVFSIDDSTGSREIVSKWVSLTKRLDLLEAAIKGSRDQLAVTLLDETMDKK